LGQDPNNQNALAALMGIDPRLGMQFQQAAERRQEAQRASVLRQGLTGAYDANTGRLDPVAARQAYVGAGDIEGAIGFDAQQAQRHRAELEQHRDRIVYGANIIRQINPKDDAGWQQVLGAMKQGGYDVSDVPPTFDPAYANGVVTAAAGFEKGKQEEEYTLAPGAIRYRGGEIIAQSPYAPTVSADGVVYERQPTVAPAGTASGDAQSYQSPVYDQLEASLEQEYGLPAGLMGRIRTLGERSNADQVSPAGARTVYQVIPATRDAFLRKYGIDAYASPENAARVAALHLKESIDRGEDPVRGYIGGPDRRKWGPQTEAYAGRVNAGLRRVASQQEFAALPSGTEFIAPDGSVRRKP
jgi:hypothetical protein